MRAVRLLAILAVTACAGACASIGGALDNLCATCCLSCLNGGGPVQRDSQVPDRNETTLLAPASSIPDMSY